MQIAKTIKEIYDEAKAKGYDLVLTNDAALATALNAMNEEPLVGVFAITPMNLAAKHAIDILGEPLWSDMRTIQTISEETDLDFRYVHGEIEKIKEIARFREDIEQFLTPSSKRVYRSWASIPTLESAMRKFSADTAEIYGGKKIGTVGVKYFNLLDRMMIPTRSQDDDICLFKDEDYRIPRIYAVGNDRQIADNAVKLIDPMNPLDYAIVMNTDSGLADAVRSALYREKIPFVNSLNVRDLNDVRDFLQLADRCMSYRTLRVRDIRSLFASLRITVSSKSDEHLLQKERFGSEKAESLRMLMEEASRYDEQGHGITFLELAEQIYKIAGRDPRRGLSSIKIVLDDLKLGNETITPQNVSKMEYAVDNVSDLHHNEQIPEDEKRGVLLADCKRSVYVDRPVVIYLGMEQDWNVELVKKPYIPDIIDETERVAEKMSVMLQQGSVRFYLVNRTKEGRAAIPTTMFNEMIKVKPKPIEKFTDLTDDYREERWYEPEEHRYQGDVRDCESKYSKPFSQTGFAQYVKCPRAFMYDSMLSTPENATMGFGKMIHEFAEAYASYKKEIQDKGIESFIDMSCERFSGLSTPLLDEMDRGKIRCAMVNITRFIDSLGLGDPAQNEWRKADTQYPNWYFANGFDEQKTMTYKECEKDDDSASHKVHGKMDLKHGDIVYDYKTGHAKTGKDIAENFSLEKLSRFPDYQCLFYLAVAYEMHGTETFVLFFAMDNDLEYADLDFDIRRNMRIVRVTKKSPDELFLDKAVIDAFRMKTSAKDLVGREEDFIRILLESCQGSMDTWSDPAANKHVRKRIQNEFALDGMFDGKTYSNNVRRLVDLVRSPVIAGVTNVLIQEEYLNQFLAAVDDMHAEMVEASCKRGGLRPYPDSKCRECDYFQVCTVDVNDEEAGE